MFGLPSCESCPAKSHFLSGTLGGWEPKGYQWSRGIPSCLVQLRHWFRYRATPASQGSSDFRRKKPRLSFTPVHLDLFRIDSQDCLEDPVADKYTTQAFCQTPGCKARSSLAIQSGLQRVGNSTVRAHSRADRLFCQQAKLFKTGFPGHPSSSPGTQVALPAGPQDRSSGLVA